MSQDLLHDFFASNDAVQVEEQLKGHSLFAGDLSARGRQYDQDMLEYLHFMLGDEHYGVELNRIKEIIKISQVTPVPRTAPHVAGIISLRGLIVPIYRLSMVLRLQQARASTGRLVLVVESTNGNVVGLMVDRIVNVVRMSQKAIEPPPATLAEDGREFVTGIGRVDTRMLVLLALDTVIEGESDGVPA